MRMMTEGRMGIGALLSLQLLTSFAAIGLLARVSPAVERILENNVSSTEAVEEMLAALAMDDASTPDRFAAGLEMARENAVEPGELPLLDELERTSAAAVVGNQKARAETIATLRALSDVNRQAMRRADNSARFQGQAGAWTSALAGFAGFVLRVLVYDRTRRRLVSPVLELHATLAAVRGGDHHRRCTKLDGPIETHLIADDLNWILEQLALIRRPLATASGLRPYLLALLERHPQPTVILDAKGEVIALNQAALDSVAAGERPRALGRAVAEGKPLPEGWTAVRGAEGWICERLPGAPTQARG